MTELPTGTVTFLFSDIEGSTLLLGRLGDRFPVVLARHSDIVRGAMADSEGIEVSTEGDSFFLVFRSAAQAVAAATRIQEELHAEPWPEGGDVRVRMGLHTGEGALGGDNYVGLDINRAARVAAAGHGGQVLLSQTTRALVERSLPPDVALRDLGQHRLKDLASPEHLYQLVIEGIPSEFPAPRTLDARPNNLPVQLTSFVGREREIAALVDLVRTHRLVTLTGPGGTGKTRLSLQAAAELLPDFEDGVFFVELAPISDPALVPTTIAEAVGVREDPGTPLVDTLTEHLRNRTVLLVLDNFEQVTEAAGLVQDLLSAAPGLRCLVSSRIVLHVYGEQEYQVLPLPLPDPKDIPDVTAFSQYEAVALFIERAMAVRPAFHITNENAPAVAEITARLDGLPLAIELAASRIKVLSPRAILARLEKRLPLLTATTRDLPERQRTLRGAIEWSYDLLDEAERTLFARVSVFVGGFTLEAAEAVCGDGLDVLDGLGSLVDKSLLRQVETPRGEARFEMLETIREYASEMLGASGEEDEIRGRHADHILSLAEEAEPQLVGSDQVEWLGRFETEHDNVRAALRWSIDTDRADIGMRIGSAIWRFWQQRGHLREGRRWMEGLLGLPSAAPRTAVRGRALGAFGSLAYWQNDFEATRPAYEESVEIFREIGDRRGLAEALFNAGYIPLLFDQDWAAARRLFGESLAIAREIEDPALVATVSAILGYASFLEGDTEAALVAYEEAVRIHRELGNRFALADSLSGAAYGHQQLGDTETALDYLREGLEIFHEAENPSGVSLVLDGMASAALFRGLHERAVRLAGAAQALRDLIGGGAPPQLTQFPDFREEARAAGLGEDEVEAAWRAGLSMSQDKAVAYALEDA